MSTPHQSPAAAIAVPSPKGRWKTEPSVRFFSSSRTPNAARISAASMNVNAPNVETISSSEPTAATRCSEPSRRQACGRLRMNSELLAPREASIGFVPVGDLVLALFPAEIDLAAVPHSREVHEPALQVTDDHLHRIQ